MNNNGFICEKTGAKMIAIRECDLTQLCVYLSGTMYMLKDLIALWQQEEKLKRHHRPYLDVRQEMGQKCASYLRIIDETAASIAMMSDGCALECMQGMDDPHEQGEETNAPEEKAVYAPSADIMDVLEDLLTVVEYLDVLSSFLSLLENGLQLNKDAAKASMDIWRDVGRILDRWEQYYCHVSEASE
jgi:hypothetical protein